MSDLSPRILIAGTFRIDPSYWEPAMAVMAEMMAETVKEAGCAAYSFSPAIDNPGLFHVFEEWDSQTALDTHRASPRRKAFEVWFAAPAVIERTLSRYVVSDKEPVEAPQPSAAERFLPGTWRVTERMEMDSSAMDPDFLAERAAEYAATHADETPPDGSRSENIEVSVEQALFPPDTVLFRYLYCGAGDAAVRVREGKIDGHLSNMNVSGTYAADRFEMRCSFGRGPGSISQIVNGELVTPA